MSLFNAQSNVNNCSSTSTVSGKKGKKRGFFAKRISEFGSFIQNKKSKPVLNASSPNAPCNTAANNDYNNIILMPSNTPTSRSALALADVLCANDEVSNLHSISSTPSNVDNSNINNNNIRHESPTLSEGLSVQSGTDLQSVNSSNTNILNANQ